MQLSLINDGETERNPREAIAPYRFFDTQKKTICLLKYYRCVTIAHAFPTVIFPRSRMSGIL